MRILVDENIPRRTVNGLRELGHDVKDVRGTTAQGIFDLSCGAWRSRKAVCLRTPESSARAERPTAWSAQIHIRGEQADHHGSLTARRHTSA